ncbi:hypothetical protein AC1031_015438 [Aphanomyces cochlioides]|nr:hypothetical protein AC1031_015438 [Aphanomyces cochlioides]
MQKTVMRCCLAVLTFVALVLEMTTPKIQNESTQQTSFEPRWTQDNVEEDPDAETASTKTNFSEEATDISVEEEDTASIEAKIECSDNANTEETKNPIQTPTRHYATRVDPMGHPNNMKKTQVDDSKAAIYALTEQILAILQAKEEAVKAKEEAVKAKEEALKAKEEALKAKKEATKAKEEATKNCQENPATQEDCSLDDPHFCCQARTNFARVLDQLKQSHVDFGYCAGVADHLHQEQTRSQQDVQPPVTHVHKTVARAAKRLQHEAGDPHATKKRRICRRVRFSFPTVKRRAMDDEADVSRAKRRRKNTTDVNARSYSEMEVLQWIEHEKRVFRKEMVAEAKHYNYIVRLQRQLWKTSQGQPRGASPASVSQATTTCSPVVTSADATAMENDCAPSIIPIVIKSAKENTCSPPIIPIVIKSAKENTCSPPIIPVAMRSAKENSRPPIVPVVDASAKRRRH